MKPKIRYNRNYTVTMIPENQHRKLEDWSFAAALSAVTIAFLAVLSAPEPRALVESDSVITPSVTKVAGTGLGS